MESILLAVTIGLFLFMVLVVIAGYLLLKQIHAAVNSNMTTALNKIEDLHSRVAELVRDAHREDAKRRVVVKKKSARRR